MCGSMVDIQSPTAEIRRGKEEEEEDRNHRAKITTARVHAVYLLNADSEPLSQTAIDSQTPPVGCYTHFVVPTTLNGSKRPLQ